MINASSFCPRCAQPLRADAEGLCPACILRMIMDVDDSEGAEPDSGLGTIRYLGNYELLGEIARGGMGVVYRARQTTLNRLVAIKVLSNGAFAAPDILRRFRAEAEMAATLEHPHIVPIFEIGEHEGLPYYSMALVEGETLTSRIGGRALPAREAVRLVATIARAVHFAHERGVLHRDIKPTNVLIDAASQPHLTDFGLAKLLHADAGLTRSQAVMGTPAFMSPEQAQGGSGGLTTAADVYSLGAILFHCLTGKPAFEGETSIAVIQQVLTITPKRPSFHNRSIARDLDVICLKCLEKQPERRYPSALALAEDLDRWLAGEPIQARPANWIEIAAKFVRRHPIPSFLAASALVSVVVGTILVGLQWRRAETALGTARERLYAADIHLAQQALAEQNRSRVLKLLDAHLPADGQADLRGFEWRYLWGQAQGNEDKLFTNGSSHTAAIAEFSPDSRFLAIGSGPGNCEIWDVAAGTNKTLPQQNGEITSVSFDSVGRHLITTSDHEVVLWRLDSSEPVWTHAIRRPHRAAFLRDDATIALTFDVTIGRPAGGSSVILSATNGAVLHSLSNAPGRALAVSPDKSLLALGSQAGSIQLWSTDKPRLIRTFTNAMSAADLAFSLDGARLVAGCWDGYLQEWDVATGTFRRELKAHRTHIWNIAFGTDGTLYTGSGDHTSRAWNEQWVETSKHFGNRGPVFAIALSTDGKWLAASASGQTRLWNVGTSSEVQPAFKSAHYRWAPPVIRSGDELIVQGPLGPKILNARTGAELAVFGIRAIAWALIGDETLFVRADDPDKPLVAWNIQTDERRGIHLENCAGPLLNKTFKLLAPGKIMTVSSNAFVWDVTSGKLKRQFKSFEGSVFGWGISPDGEFLVAGGEVPGGGAGNVISLRDHTIKSTFSVPATVEMVAFNESGTRMAVASWDHSVYVYSFPDLRERMQLRGHLGSVYDVAFTQDGQVLSGSEDGRTVLWDLRTGLEMMTFPYAHCATFQDKWILSSQGHPRTGANELRILSALSFDQIERRKSL